MTLQELKEKAYQLSVSDRLALISAVIQSLQETPQSEDWQYLVARPYPWRKQLLHRKTLCYSKALDMLKPAIQLLIHDLKCGDIPAPARFIP